MGKEQTQFKEGNRGRPKGATNKTTRAVKEVFASTFHELQEDENATYHLYNWAKRHPKEFYQLAARLIPTEITGAAKQAIRIQVVRTEKTKQHGE